MQWAEYFPYFFVGIMILATMAWIAYTVMSSNSKCLESQGMDDGHQEDVHTTDVSGNETVEDVENKLLDTISSICEEMETGRLKMLSVSYSNFEQCTMQCFLEILC